MRVREPAGKVRAPGADHGGLKVADNKGDDPEMDLATQIMREQMGRFYRLLAGEPSQEDLEYLEQE